ncbi:MAG: hypothetical protein B193_0050 [Solidesulfovibrio magneticus str. Maddingley MBC34]|uniref:Arylsulfatase n=1 Tax=Solidesulfovibrio magneticus str. Maddingley MBC34 TaxID=1206767 RepID=K6GJC7_9BACT|nr:MAG: hypothetical protein B193_0050 [Solidesulfovibrio magneticus str. Maddingley MBC34]
MLNGVMVPVEDQLKCIYDAWGSDKTYPHMAALWAWAFDTPFPWTKQVASHLGVYGFYVLKGKPVFLWNLVDLERVRWEGPELTPGKHVLEFDFAYDGLGMGTLAFNNFSGVGRGGTGVLKVDGQAVDTRKMEHTLPFILQWDEALDIGSDTLTGVNDADYQTPFPFTGKIDKITLTVDRPKLSPEDEKKLAAAQQAKGASD